MPVMKAATIAAARALLHARTIRDEAERGLFLKKQAYMSLEDKYLDALRDEGDAEKAALDAICVDRVAIVVPDEYYEMPKHQPRIQFIDLADVQP